MSTREPSSDPAPSADLLSSDLPAGAVVGEYRIERRIARGGCGLVYDARHLRVPRRAAVKVLHASLADQPKMVERFFREVELVNLLRHPAIVTIHEVGVLADRRPFYAMDYLDGGTLEDRLRAAGKLTPEEALTILSPVCDALEAAHAAGVVHRDVKASNIAFDGERGVKLLDFGIAKLIAPDPGQACLTSVGRQLGTPTIMPPEQFLGSAVDARADVYALGVLLYRMLTGRPPFDGKTAGALALQHREKPAPRPSRLAPAVGPAIDAVVLRCLEKQPARRFASAGAFAATFAEALGISGSGPTSSRVARARGVAIYVELHTDAEAFDDALTADMEAVLNVTEAALRGAGFSLALLTGNAVLGVRLLTGDDGSRARAAVAAAEALAARLGGRPGPDPRVRPAVAMHAGDVHVRPGPDPEIIGGPLLCPADWAPTEPPAGVAISPAVRREVR